eukprot:1174296-Karenia_brevis.AAC.1
MQWVWEAYNKNIATINGCERHINGIFRLLRQGENITETEELIETTEIVSGCQALRRKISHIRFGFRVVCGESIFFAIKPSGRNTALLLYLSRTRTDDACLTKQRKNGKIQRRAVRVHKS